MTFFEDVVLKDAIEINTTADRIFAFLTGIVDTASYKAWHNKDHVAFQWITGSPWTEGSVLYAEEYLHGKLHKFTFKVIEVIPNKRIVYAPTSHLMRMFFPKNAFEIARKDHSCVFTASCNFRVGRIGRMFFNKAIERGLSGARNHMKEEGENMKRILEGS